MKDLLNIIIAERRTLLRGFLVACLFIFPLTFLPILGDGLTWKNMGARLPDSLLYTCGLSLIVVIVALNHNYQNLRQRKKHFDRPAFTRLNFYGRLDGVGSIVHELETFLLGRIGDYWFRLNVVHPEQDPLQVEIVPLIQVEGQRALKATLQKELGFREHRFFGLLLLASQEDLARKDFLLDVLTELERKLRELGVKAMPVDENTLDEK